MRTEQKGVIRITKLTGNSDKPKVRVDHLAFTSPGPYFDDNVWGKVKKLAQSHAKRIDNGEGKTFLQENNSPPYKKERVKTGS